METRNDRAVTACRMIADLEEEDSTLGKIAEALLDYYLDQKITLAQVEDAMHLVQMLKGRNITESDAEKIAQAILAKEKRGCRRLTA